MFILTRDGAALNTDHIEKFTVDTGHFGTYIHAYLNGKQYCISKPYTIARAKELLVELVNKINNGTYRNFDCEGDEC